MEKDVLEQQDRLWTKNFISISVVNFVLMLSMYLLLVTIATYAAEKYGVSTSTAGLISGIFIIGSLIGRLYAGKQIAAVGNKKMLITGITIVVIMTAFYFIPGSIALLFFVRLVHGVGLGIATTSTGTIVSQVIPKSRNGEGIGYFSLSTVLATAIGPLIGILLMGSVGFTSIFIFSFVVGALSLIFGLLITVPQVKSAAKSAGGSESHRFKLSRFFEPKALPISIAVLVIGFAYSSVLSFITAYAADIHLVKTGSLFFLAYAIAALLSRPFTGKLIDRRGGNSVAYPALIIFAVGMLVLSQAHSSIVILLAAALIGLGNGNFQSCSQALAVRAIPRHRMGLANSTYFIFLDLGLGFGPFALGYLVPELGYRGLYLALVGVIVAGIGVYYVLHGRKDKALTAANG
ncbi:major facilitator superfamily transporter [compost metagenome]